MVNSSSIADTVTRAEAGDATAAAQLVELLYVELRKLARARLAKRTPGQTIQATELVHEAYLRVAGRKEHGWDGRGHFFFAAARAMRDIMIERGRKKKAVRHGGALVRVEIAENLLVEFPDREVEALDRALGHLEERFPDHHRVVMLRYFAGLTGEETADVLGLSRRTQTRRWEFARSWLRRELGAADSPGER